MSFMLIRKNDLQVQELRQMQGNGHAHNNMLRNRTEGHNASNFQGQLLRMY